MKGWTIINCKETYIWSFDCNCILFQVCEDVIRAIAVGWGSCSFYEWVFGSNLHFNFLGLFHACLGSQSLLLLVIARQLFGLIVLTYSLISLNRSSPNSWLLLWNVWEQLTSLSVLNEFLDFLSRVDGLQLLAKLDTQFVALAKVHHFHVADNIFVLVVHDAQTYSVQQKLVNFLLFVR